MNYSLALGSAIIAARINKEQLSEKSGVPEDVIQSIMEDGYSPELFGPSVWEQLAKGFGVPVPILSFLGLEEADISGDKREMYKLLRDPIRSLISQIILIRPTEPEETNED
jgi:hypothetical protein